MSLNDACSVLLMYLKIDADVRPPISVAATRVMAVRKMVLSVKSCPIFWLNCFSYETKLSRIFALKRIRLWFLCSNVSIIVFTYTFWHLRVL
jgi:hypothetical protein